MRLLCCVLCLSGHTYIYINICDPTKSQSIGLHVYVFICVTLGFRECLIIIIIIIIFCGLLGQRRKVLGYFEF
jgi:hypothetical protein